KKLVDQLTYVENLRIEHSGTFFSTPAMVPVQFSGGRFTLAFNCSKMSEPGSYSDVIKLVRPTDGLVLARIPVVIEIPATAKLGAFFDVNQQMKPFDTIRMPVKLDRASPLILQ